MNKVGVGGGGKGRRRVSCGRRGRRRSEGPGNTRRKKADTKNLSAKERKILVQAPSRPNLINL